MFESESTEFGNVYFFCYCWRRCYSSSLVFLQPCGLSELQKPHLYSQSPRVRPRIIFYTYILSKTMHTFDKKRTSFFCENKLQRKRWKPENRIFKSGIQPLTESGIHGCGIRNPQTWNLESTGWNPESKTLLDYLTWGETFTCFYVLLRRY